MNDDERDNERRLHDDDIQAIAERAKNLIYLDAAQSALRKVVDWFWKGVIVILVWEITKALGIRSGGFAKLLGSIFGD